MFEHDRSAARGQMVTRKLVAFKHNSKMGNAPSHKLFELVTINPAENSGNPPRKFSDYKISIDNNALPDKVGLIENMQDVVLPLRACEWKYRNYPGESREQG